MASCTSYPQELKQRVSPILMYPPLRAGRFLSGIAAGMVCVGVPLYYAADLTPSRQSQFYASLWQLAVVMGAVVGAVANWWLVDLSADPSTGANAWRYLAGLPVQAHEEM